MLKAALPIAFAACASAASAQPVFVQGSIGTDVRRFSGEAGASPFDGSPTAMAFAIGSEFTPHWIVSAEIDLGGRSTTTSTTRVVIGTQTRDIHTSFTSERRSVSALAGYRTSAARRVQVGYYAGVSFSTLRREIVSDAESIVLQTPVPGSIFEDRVTGAIVGIDVAIRLAPHVAIVPGLRAQGLTTGSDLSGHSIRPSIGARLSF